MSRAQLRLRSLFAAAFVLFGSALWAADPLTEMVRRSGFVFRGTVVRLHAATATVPPEERTAVVKVEEIFEAQTELRRLAGQEVTVRLLAPASAAAGSSRIFFTHLYSLGASAGLEEVGSLDPQEATEVRTRIAAARRDLADEALQTRLADAVAVVVATVVKPRAAEAARNRGASEHDPQWRQARITVESVAKPGASATPKEALTVFFAGSDDVMWFEAPKLEEGQRAILLLHTGARGAFKPPGLAVVDKLDVQPVDELARVKRLLAATR
jgi:hypothetical protein